MAKSTSTRFKDLRGRPLDYRTPSPPPRSAIEDIPPLTPPTQGIFNTSFVRTKLSGRKKRGADNSYKRTNYRTPSPPPRSAIEAISPLTPVRSAVDFSTSEIKTKKRRIAQPIKSGQNDHNRRERMEKRGVQDGSRWNTRGGDDETEGEDESYSAAREDRSRLAVASNFGYDKNGVEYHTNAQSTHHFSSAMDAIATIAMATSPTFGPQSHQLPSAFLQSHYPSQYPPSQFPQHSLPHSPRTHTSSEERPAKRARPDMPSEVSVQESHRPQVDFSNPVAWTQSYSQQTTWNRSSGPAMVLPQRRQTNITDSDAELLLNVGRVAVFAKPSAPKLTKQLESNENGRLDMAFANQPGSITESWAETSSSVRNTEKSAEIGSLVHHQLNAIGANGANPGSHTVGENEARGLNGAASPLIDTNLETAQTAAIGSRMVQDLPSLPKPRDLLEINGANGAVVSPLTIIDQPKQPQLLSVNDGSASGFGREQPGWQPGWPNGIFGVGRQNLEMLPYDQGTAQKPHLELGPSPISPTVDDQKTRLGSSHLRVGVGENASELAETVPGHERQDVIPISLLPEDHTINSIEAHKVEAIHLPRERDVIDGVEMSLAKSAHLHPEQETLTETVLLPQEEDVKGDVGSTSAEAISLPQTQSVTEDIRMTSAGAASLSQERDTIDSTEVASISAVPLSQDRGQIGAIVVTSAKAVPLPTEHDIVDVVEATSGEAVGASQEHDLALNAEESLTEALPLPQEQHTIDNVEATTSKTYSRGAEQRGLVDASVENDIRTEEVSGSDHEVAPSSISDIEEDVALETRVEENHNDLNDGDQGFIQELKEFVERSTDEKVGTPGTDSPAAGATPAPGLLEYRDVSVENQTDEVESVSLQATPAESPHMVRVESQPPSLQATPAEPSHMVRSESQSSSLQATSAEPLHTVRSESQSSPPQATPAELSRMARGEPQSSPLQTTPAEPSQTVQSESRSSSLQATSAEPPHVVRGETPFPDQRGPFKQSRRGWPKGKPRGPRSSWPGVIKAKEGIRADDKTGSLSRANRSAGRKENQNEGPVSHQQPQKNFSAGATGKMLEDARRDISSADPKRGAGDSGNRESNVSVDIRSQNVTARHSRPPNMDTLFPTPDPLSENGSLLPFHQPWRGDANPPPSMLPQDSTVSLPKRAQVSLQAAVTIPPSSLDSSGIRGSMANASSPTVTQRPINRRALYYSNPVPDMLIDPQLLDPQLLDPQLLDPQLLDPQLLAPGSGSQDAGHGDIPPLIGAFSTSPGYGQDFTGRNTEAKENASGREGVSTEAEQSICAGCSMLPNSLGGDSYLETISWIKCDGCKRWFHYACAGFTEKEVRSVDKFSCPACWEKCGPTTFVRKSSRAHTSIDYAGLHEGVVKTSEESLDHPYVKPIKDGTIKFLPESFPRLRPEVATREFFERNGMKEPVVIPGSMNPRPGTAPDVDQLCCDLSEGESQVFTKQAIDYWLAGDFDRLHGPNHGQDAMDMVIPQNLTVRKVAQLYGPGEKVEVINVKSQGEDGPWNMKKWADYYESNNKQFIRNVISLEISTSELGRLVKRPQVVRDMDLADSVWPPELRAKGDFPKVQLYCLMSVENSFTDFHIDFGGSSVFYHILKGRKTFLFIPPKHKHLKKYEQWCLSPAQNQTFLPDQTKECVRVDLSAGDTMLIPSGWIHAVWTPEDSLVIGGNFLTRMHYGMQISIAEIEKNTKVPRKFRYPSFQRVLWFAAIQYLKDDPVAPSLVEKFNCGEVYKRDVPLYQDFDNWGVKAMGDPEAYNARYYSQAELDGLPNLMGYLLRTALISIGKITDGITVDTRQRVTRSIPKGYGDALEIAKRFAMWSAWKRGNEVIPHWAYRGAVPGDGIAGVGEKKLSAAAIKRLEREATAQEIIPGRQSMRKRAQIEAAALSEAKSTTPDFVPGAGSPFTPAAKKPQPKVVGEKRARAPTAPSLRLGDMDGNPVPIKPIKTPKTSVLGPKRVACDECRKRRVRCKHKDLLEPDEPEVEGSSMTRNTTPKSEPGKDTVPSAQNLTDTNPLNRNSTNPDPQQAQSPIIIGASSDPLATQQQTPAKTISATPAPSGSSGKHRACEKCRKNRRRCIHDGNGNVDPIKAQEPPTPRATSSSKRGRPATFGTVDTGRYFKKTKLEPEITNSFSNISEGLTDVIRVRPVIPDPLRSFDISGQHALQRQRLAAESANQRALDTERRSFYKPMVMSSAWEHPQVQEPSSKVLQQAPSIPMVMVDASERQLLREEACRIDKEVSAEGVVRVAVPNGTAAPTSSTESQGTDTTSSLDDSTNANTNADLLGAVQPTSISPITPALNISSTPKNNPGNVIDQSNSTSPPKISPAQNDSQQIRESITNNSTFLQETASRGPRSEPEQINFEQTATENVKAEQGDTETRQVEPEHEEIETEKIGPEQKEEETEAKNAELETTQLEPEHREIESDSIGPERAAVEVVQTVLEDAKLETTQLKYEQGNTDTKRVDSEKKEVKTSSISAHKEMETATEREGVEKEWTGNDCMESRQMASELAKGRAKTGPSAFNRTEQVSLQSSHRNMEHKEFKQVESGQCHTKRKEPGPTDHDGTEAEQSPSDKMELELDSSSDDLSSPPDSPLSELDMSSPEPEPGTKAEPQTESIPQVDEITSKSPSPTPEQRRRRSKRETKEVQRFSAASTTGSHNKHHPNGREASRTPAPHVNYKSMSPNLEFPSPGKTYARKSGRPVITPCKTAPLSRPGSIFAMGEDASLAVQGAARGKTPFPEGGSAADDEEKVSEVDEESWRLAKEMEFGLRRKGLK